MQLSRRVSLLEERENRRLGGLRTRKKHKKLDAICENAYKLNHRGVEIENKADVDEGELRRSTRVRRAPVVLDASPSPAKKRRRVKFRNEYGSDNKVKKREGTSGNVERGSGCWGDRLRARTKTRKNLRRDSLRRRKRRLFKVEDKDSGDDVELINSMSTVVKSKRPGRIKASNVVKNTKQDIELSSDEGQSSESDTDEEEMEEVEHSKIKSEASDHEESDEHADQNEVEGEERNSEAEDNKENDEVDAGETSESDEDREDNENNNIRDHKGKKKEKNEVETIHSSDNDEHREDAKEFEGDKAKNEAGDVKENDDVDVCEHEKKQEVEDNKEENDDEEHKGSDQVTEKPSHEINHLLSNGDVERSDGNATNEVEKEVSRGSDNPQTMELDEQVERQNSNAKETEIGMSSEKPLDNVNAKKRSQDSIERRYFRAGRRCDLCGTGTDGKLPKKVVGNGSGSDHEVSYSGSSASEEIKFNGYDGFDEEPGWLGRLLGPINDRYGIAGIWVHQNCAVWSPEVYFAGLGCLKNVSAALSRGRALRCTRCSRTGATIGCRVDRCPKTYHLPCARAIGCIFDHRKFLIACTDHRHLFQPHGAQYRHKIKKLKAKKLKLEMKKASGDAWRKDLEAEEKYLENCGEDEEFLKRESKRLHRDILRIAPVYIGGPNSNNETEFQGWESVAGLQNVIQSLKEMVILPLLYPDFFSNMGITPPRGVLLHGYPGTGKTLVVRALIGACARGDKRIAYFARKGADCLGKYVGDAERQLRLLFQVAEKSQPSIIFFDEIDGLAPCRTRQQDQTHNSVVSTLLALMDGLKSRGSVVVIGATNRPDSVDAALRRPGRFDREIYFPLPSAQDREAILSLHTRKWPKPVTGSLLKQIAKRTVGFAGADLQSLCTQAAITALRRSCPFQKILSAAEKKGPIGKHPPLPPFVVEERDWLEALIHAPPPCSQRGTEMSANDVISSPLDTHLAPCLLQPLTVFLASLCRDERILLPSPLYKAVALVKRVVISALDQKKISVNNWWSRTPDMLLEVDVLKEVEIKLSRCEILNGQASDSRSNIGDEDAINNDSEVHCPKVQQIGTHTSLLQNVTCGSEKKVGFWLLISGSPRCGQKYLASCLLHCFRGDLEIQKLDSATIAQEGQGDLLQGITRILMKCASVGSSLIYMPRIDLWGIETYNQLDGDESDSSAKNYGLPGQDGPEFSETDMSVDISPKTSLLWNMFVEQVESISVSSTLTILATSELLFDALPDGIRQFFKTRRSNQWSSSPLEEGSRPRFSVHLDGRFSRDSVLNSSAIELCKDLVLQYVQLTHQKVHINASLSAEIKNSEELEGDADDQRPVNEVEKTPYSNPPNSRPSKGKSNMLLAISSLGYQILRYPHFAELCWATSKLKEGPCTDTRGPWKGWPFNSCIVRHNKSSEQIVVAGSSSNIKSRENYGLVRGLVAVGLSAYRCTYTSVREVSSEVRKVLELMADKINAKIRAGKYPHHYIRLLSQMAYFEDVVNSWAYSLQSLEEDAQTTLVPASNLINLKPPDNMPFEDITERKDGSEPGVSAKSPEDTTKQKDGSEPDKRYDAVLEKNTRNFDLNEPIEEDNSNNEERIIVDKPHEQMLFSHSIPDSNEQDGNKPSNHPSENGVCESIIPNGFANTETIFIDEDGPCSGDKGNENPSTFQDATNSSSKEGKLSSLDGQNKAESNEKSISNDSKLICFYFCCSNCLEKLRETIREILNYEWGLREESGIKVEDVQDLFASVSMTLQSSLRKIFASKWEKSREKIKKDNFRGMSGNQGEDTCQCRDLENGPMRPKECRCHSTTNFPQNSQREDDLKLICRDGVVSLLDPNEVTSTDFHCKFESVCLCSLIEWIVKAKQPSA